MVYENRRRNRRGAKAAACAAALLLGAGCAYVLTRVREGEVVSNFPHRVHVVGAEMGCADCHGGGTGQGLPSFPGREGCARCHDEKAEPELFSRFFTAEGASWVHAGRQSEEIIFDHPSHATGGEASCRTCHERVVTRPAIFPSAMVGMDECVACHERHGRDPLACETCHRRINRETRPESHDQGWLERHGPHWSARTEGGPSDRCTLCHQQGACDDCHTTRRPRSHNTYWRGRGHGIAAGIDRSRCNVCHGRDTCDRCHSRMRPRDHTATFGSPSNRHCYTCHLPIDLRGRCGVCHLSTPSHDAAEPMEDDDTHRTATDAECRSCHAPVPHPDNGDSCRFCHRG